MRVRRLAIWLALGLSLACASARYPDAGRDTPAASESILGLSDQDRSTQRILRARYEAASGPVSFRMVLRLVSEERYQLSAADPFGRRLWALDYDHPEVHFVDYRARTECRAGRATAPVEVAFEILRLTELPVVLVGRLPGGLEPTKRQGGGLEYRDLQGRRWTAKASDSSLAGWTLWDQGRPTLWLRADDSGSVLSHRRGEQFRWRQTRVEPLAQDLEAIRTPDGVQTVPCREMMPGSSGPSGSKSDGQ